MSAVTRVQGRLAARIRMPLLIASTAALVLGFAANVQILAAVAAVAVLAGLALYFRLGTARAAPRELGAPVRGRWIALNSPADRVPSHGLHAYGQTYAIDLVPQERGERPAALRWWPATRPADAATGFGAPVVAPAAGRVVRAVDGARDHRTRDSWLALPWFFVEASLRELGGPGRLLGNHLVLEIGDGGYALLAHLRRGSIAVRVGDEVVAGQPLAACGNSGSSTEPHVHFQVMDHPRPLLAAGLPFRFADARGDDGTPVAVPRAGTAITA